MTPVFAPWVPITKTFSLWCCCCSLSNIHSEKSYHSVGSGYHSKLFLRCAIPMVRVRVPNWTPFHYVGYMSFKQLKIWSNMICCGEINWNSCSKTTAQKYVYLYILSERISLKKTRHSFSCFNEKEPFYNSSINPT